MGRTEVAGLPAGGPATLAGARLALGIMDPDDVRDDARIEAKVNAANRFVRSQRCAVPAIGLDDWSTLADVTEGANMLVARLFRRKNSPAGVETIGPDGSAAYVARNDPDVSMLLQLGTWRGPQLG